MGTPTGLGDHFYWAVQSQLSMHPGVATFIPELTRHARLATLLRRALRSSQVLSLNFRESNLHLVACSSWLYTDTSS